MYVLIGPGTDNSHLHRLSRFDHPGEKILKPREQVIRVLEPMGTGHHYSRHWGHFMITYHDYLSQVTVHNPAAVTSNYKARNLDPIP